MDLASEDLRIRNLQLSLTHLKSNREVLKHLSSYYQPVLLSLLVEPILQAPYTHEFTSHALSPFSPVPSPRCIIYPPVDRAQIDTILPPSQKWLILSTSRKSERNLSVRRRKIALFLWSMFLLVTGEGKSSYRAAGTWRPCLLLEDRVWIRNFQQNHTCDSFALQLLGRFHKLACSINNPLEPQQCSEKLYKLATSRRCSHYG